jgi:hypothetical protein
MRNSFEKLFPGLEVKLVTVKAAMEAFVAKTPVLEYAYEDGEHQIHFNVDSEDMVLYIRADVNANLDDVFQGVIKTFCPTITHVTEYKHTLEDTMLALSDLYMDMFDQEDMEE